MSTKSTVDSIASSAEMVAFTIPKAGPFIAGGIAIVKGLFDIFYPKEKTDPGSLAVNVRQFKAAMTDMKAFVDRDVTRISNKEARQGYLAEGITLFNHLTTVTNDANTKQSAWSERTDYTQEDIDGWHEDLKTFTAPLDADDNPILKTLVWLDLKPENQNDNLEMYLYFINLYMHYAHFAIALESQIALKQYQFDLLNYTKDKDGDGDNPGYAMRLKIWKMKEAKQAGSGGAKPTPPTKVVNDLKDKFGINSKYARHIKPEIAEFVDTLESVIKSAKQKWNDRETHISNGLKTFKVFSRVASEVTGTTVVKDIFSFGLNAAVNGKDKYNKYWVHTPSDYTPSGPNSWRNDSYSAKKAMEKFKKNYKVKEYKKLGDKYQLNNLTLSDLNTYAKIVANLKKAIKATQGQEVIHHVENNNSGIMRSWSHMTHPA